MTPTLKFTMKTNLPLSALLGALLLFEPLSGWAVDANGDGLDDAWATSHGISAFTGSEDPDGDGRPNLVESLNWTKPADAANPDTGWGMVWITDQDNDKLDDHWMVRYMHNGTPLLPYDDEDGDMRKNIEESIVGTNPWVVDAPWQSLSGAPTSSTGPGSFTLSFRGIPGQSYLIEKCTDMVTWQQDQEVWGSGQQQVVTINTGTETRMFFRIQLRQTNGDALDSDGDGLLDWYELFVFNSDRFNPDSDGDGMPDGWEAMYGLNLTSALDALADEDADGIANLDEFTFELDPLHDDFGEEASVISFDSSDHVQSVSAGSGAFVSYIYDAEGNLLTSN